MKDLSACQIGRGLGVIGVHQLTFGCTEVHGHIGRVVRRVCQSVDGRTPSGTVGVDRGQGAGNGRDGQGGIGAGAHAARTERRQSRQAGEGHAHGIRGGAVGPVGPNLVVVGGGRIEKVDAVPGRAVDDGGHPRFELAELLVQGGSVRCAIGVVGGLDGQLIHAKQGLGERLRSAVSRLDHADAIVGVADGLVQTQNTRLHAVADSQTGGIVRGRVDPQACRQLAHGRVELSVVHR